MSEPLTLLGSQSSFFTSPDDAMLESFPNRGTRPYTITLDTHEFSSLCPVSLFCLIIADCVGKRNRFADYIFSRDAKYAFRPVSYRFRPKVSITTVTGKSSTSIRRMASAPRSSYATTSAFLTHRAAEHRPRRWRQSTQRRIPSSR